MAGRGLRGSVAGGWGKTGSRLLENRVLRVTDRTKALIFLSLLGTMVAPKVPFLLLPKWVDERAA